MRKETAINLCKKCVGRIQYRGARATLQNPAALFTRDEKRGRFRGMPDDVVADMRAEAEEAAVLWDGKPRRAAGSILVDVLAGSASKDPSLRRRAAEAFAGLLADDPDVDPAGDWTPDEVAASAAGAEMELPFEGAPPEPFPDRSPAEIRDVIASRVLGQPEAAKAAALIVHNHLAGRRTNAVLAGPSGCGKSEIWRVLAGEYPGLVRVVDFSRFASEGWAGSLHVRDIFEGMDMQSFQQHGMIAVLDEADKILCESAVGSGGTDHHVLLQNDLLKIMDGDVVEFGEEGKRSPLSVDCSKVSVVMLGAFEKLREGQARAAKRIGFVAEHIQNKCREDAALARLVMDPAKSMVNCFQYINRKARKYAEQEMKDEGIQRTGVYGLDVPDGLVYQWAEEYFRDENAKEDHENDEKFVPKPYVPTSPNRKKAQGKAAKKPVPTEKPKAGKPADAGMDQLSLM